MTKSRRSDDDIDQKLKTGAASDPVAQLTASWEKAHQARSQEVQNELLKQYPDSPAAESLLHGLIAHDIALSETLGRAENQLAQRLAALPDRPAIALALARTLRHVVAARDGATKRVQGMLETSGILRGQRKLAERPALRRVV